VIAARMIMTEITIINSSSVNPACHLLPAR
jgi:hypothetical protein